ncbi:Protein of unknown function [Filimonas lacunae]|uniref:DUF3037 domain-containing protein n=1 Tax=Filimonas lacunae TaxID=477680 RepID=A0A173ME27_9BACT|nr:DUF3037 domain-containing protein [Filimonas lacunae]BAV05852.1 hypothetical protein FLA_1864 [Filimonas lacunae]SIT28361.1 Protein of unknown function [Filimonas lacunae]
MQEKHLFEYAILRVVPRVEREEFINVGVVLYSRPRFLQAVYYLDEQRLATLCNTMDIAEVKAYLEAFERICNAAPGSGPIGKLGVAERFRWLTATRSTILQTSRVHPGYCANPQETLHKLHQQLVL